MIVSSSSATARRSPRPAGAPRNVDAFYRNTVTELVDDAT